MENIVKARKIHKCIVCDGNIQKGEKYIFERYRQPEFDDCEVQIGVIYYECKRHNKECFPRLLHFENTKMILKNCNFGIHKDTYDMDPDSCDDTHWCEWCGEKLN